MKKINHLFLFIIVFIVFYFIFLFLYYDILVNAEIIQYVQRVPVMPLIGFSIIIIVFFYFFIVNKRNQTGNITIKFLNEYSIKIFVFSLMIFAYFMIPPISFSNSIISWAEIGLLNYFRAVIFIFGGCYLIGSSIYNIFLSKIELEKRFKVESFIVKLVLYPLLSFSLLGVCTLILDYFDLKRDDFSIILFLIIILITILDFILNRRKFVNNLKINTTEIKISRNTVLILILSVAVILINVGIQLSTQYLIEGDAWRSVQYAYFIGDITFEPFWVSGSYVRYWGFISYGLSSLSGIPYLNANVFNIFFSYLWVISIYLLMKVLLFNKTESYSILATIFVITFSGLFYPLNSDIPISGFILNNIFEFDYKGFANVLFVVASALFILMIRGRQKNENSTFFEGKRRITVLFLISFLLIQSTMIYFLPILPALLLFVISSYFFQNRTQNFKHFIILFLFFIILFIIFDFFSYNFFSYFSMNRLYFMTGLNFFQENKYNELIFYLILVTFLILIMTFNFILQKSNFIKDHIKFNWTFLLRLSYYFLFGFFVVIITIQISIILTYPYTNFAIFYLNLLFQNIGYIGLLGILTSYYCYKKDRKLFFFLSFLIILIIGISSSLIFTNWIKYPLISPIELSNTDYDNMIYWFTRMWQYSIIPFSVFSSIGLIQLVIIFEKKNSLFSNKFSRYRLFLKKYLKIRKKIVIKSVFTSVLIFLSFSNTILSVMYYYNKYNKDPIVHQEVQIIGWVSQNIAYNSKILVEDGQLNYRLRDISFCDSYDLNSEVKGANKIGKNIIEYLYFKEIPYFIYKNDQYELINTLYNEKLYQYGDLFLYYTNFSNFNCVEGEGIYNATHNFQCDLIGQPPKQWSVSTQGGTTIQVVEAIDGHKNVVEIKDVSEGYHKLQNNFEPRYWGTVELWIQTTNASKLFFIDLREGSDWATRIFFENNTFNVYGKILSNVTNEKWYHVRVDFRLNNASAYLSLKEGTFEVWIDGIKRVEDHSINSNIEKVDSFILMSSFPAKNYSMFIDAIGYSWDENYAIGNNFY